MKPTVALALGGGGARSLAQIPVLEALDELGIRPVAIAGASFGALIAAAYAAGMSGKAIRRAAITLAHDRGEVWRRLMAARAAGFSEWLASPWGNPLLLDAEKFCAAFLPAELPDDFAALKIPLTVVATDLYARSEATMSSGSLRPALAASIAIPGLMRPVERDGRVLVDGAAVNPLPFDRLRGKADVVIAVDASVGPGEPRGVPDPWEALFATMSVIGHGIVAQKLREGAPDLMLRPNAGVFRLFDFFHASAIMRAAEPVKAELKAQLQAMAAA
jgi:NTE family protein